MQKDNPEMTAGDVIEIVRLLEQNYIDVCVDGGWGVDALLGEQTRPHADMDIAIQHKDMTGTRVLLEGRGFKDVPRDDTRDCNFVLGDDRGHLVDIHTYTFDSAGNFVYGIEYPFESLNGTGSVDGVPVKCITPEWMVKFHTDISSMRTIIMMLKRSAGALESKFPPCMKVLRRMMANDLSGKSNQ